MKIRVRARESASLPRVVKGSDYDAIWCVHQSQDVEVKRVVCSSEDFDLVALPAELSFNELLQLRNHYPKISTSTAWLLEDLINNELSVFGELGD